MVAWDEEVQVKGILLLVRGVSGADSLIGVSICAYRGSCGPLEMMFVTTKRCFHASRGL